MYIYTIKYNDEPATGDVLAFLEAIKEELNKEQDVEETAHYL